MIYNKKTSYMIAIYQHYVYYLLNRLIKLYDW